MCCILGEFQAEVQDSIAQHAIVPHGTSFAVELLCGLGLFDAHQSVQVATGIFTDTQ
jgi:hypothetical protein